MISSFDRCSGCHGFDNPQAARQWRTSLVGNSEAGLRWTVCLVQSTYGLVLAGDHVYKMDYRRIQLFEEKPACPSELPELNLYDQTWPIHSMQHQLPPASYVFDDEGRRNRAFDSLDSSDCIFSGAMVRHSMLFSKAQVGNGSVVEDSLVTPAMLGQSLQAEA